LSGLYYFFNLCGSSSPAPALPNQTTALATATSSEWHAGSACHSDMTLALRRQSPPYPSCHVLPQPPMGITVSLLASSNLPPPPPTHRHHHHCASPSQRLPPPSPQDPGNPTSLIPSILVLVESKDEGEGRSPVSKITKTLM
jgi:hypothetical protein